MLVTQPCLFDGIRAPGGLAFLDDGSLLVGYGDDLWLQGTDTFTASVNLSVTSDYRTATRARWVKVAQPRPYRPGSLVSTFTTTSKATTTSSKGAISGDQIAQ